MGPSWIVVPLLFATAKVGEVETEELGEHRALRVLYAGVEGTPRFEAFAAFLRAHFDGAATIDVTKLGAEAMEAADVVVIDGRRLYPMDPERPSLDLPAADVSSDCTKPIVVIGAMGGRVQHHTKLDWL